MNSLAIFGIYYNLCCFARNDLFAIVNNNIYIDFVSVGERGRNISLPPNKQTNRNVERSIANAFI